MIELEKEFFDTFNIKQCGQCEFTGSPNCSTCEVCYPALTPEIYLQLICVLRNSYIPSGVNVEALKETILQMCIKFRNDKVTLDTTVYDEIQEIFKDR